MTRRDFLKRTSLATGALTLASNAELRGLEKYPTGLRGAERVEEIPSICEICFWRCGILANVDKHGRVLKIDGNPEHPLTQGRLCARGNAGHKLLYDPDRLKYPLLRVGERGEGKFKRVSWDEALEFLAEKLTSIKEKYGPEAVGYFPHGIHARFFSHLMKAYGTPNSVEPAFAQCRGPRDVAYRLTFGRSVGSPEPVDFEHTKLMVLIGTHIGENVFTGQVLQFAEALERGAKLLVVDPRFSTAASKADWWLPIKPGTDTALLLAWIHVLINEGLYDKEYIKRYAYGLNKLKSHVKGFTPEWAEKTTEIPAQTITETARAMARIKPAVGLHPGRHVTWYGNDTQRGRAMAILTALLGAYGRPGGLFLPSSVPVPKFPSPPYPKRKPRADGAGTLFPLASTGLGVTNGLVDATITEDPYPIKGWVVYGQNIIQSIPQPEKTKKAIENLDLLAVIDVMPTEQMAYADIVLPEATYLERYDDLLTVKNSKKPFAAIRQPVVKPMFESKPGWWIAKQLANRLGLQDYFQWETIEEYLDYRLAPLGVNLKHVQAKGIVAYDESQPYLDPKKRAKFKTASGKIELYSTTLAELGFDAMPVYEPVEDVPKGYFRLLYGRSPVHSFARTQNNEILNSYMPENAVWLNDKVAEELGLNDGESINLENQDGVVSDPIKLYVTPGIRPDCVFTVHGFGEKNPLLSRANQKGTSDTELMTRVNLDPISGGTGMRVNFVRIVKNGAPLMIAGAVEFRPSAQGPNTSDLKKRPRVKVKAPKDEEEGC
ncbi:molybdopterin-dependent oxidoreductase [bacterium]|nr:molybdopterin-dependent oxidoreductase [bacterium]